MLHTLWTLSLFCMWGWIVQEEPLPCPGTAGPPGEGPGAGAVLVLTQGPQVLHRGAASSDQSSWVCVWGVKKGSGGTASTTATQTSAPAHYWHTHRLVPLRISVSGTVVIPCQGQVWTNIPGTWKKGGEWHISILGVLARCCATSAVLVLMGVPLITTWLKSEKLSRLLSWMT